jgi:hypothetical protein
LFNEDGDIVEELDEDDEEAEDDSVGTWNVLSS